MVEVYSERENDGSQSARTCWYKVEIREWHREDGPAIEWDDGDKEWYQHGMLHRDDGPAMVWASGDVAYYIRDKLVTEEEYRLWQFIHSKSNA